MDLRLRPLRPADEHQATAAHTELEPEGFEFLARRRPGTRWSETLATVAAAADGIGLPAG